MRYGTVATSSGPVLAEIEGEQMRAIGPASTAWDAVLAGPHAGERAAHGDVVEGRLLAPIMPGKIIAIGLNYQDHIDETGIAPPANPLIFAKFPNSVIGPTDDIVVDPALTARVDWEVELGVIIRDRCRAIPPDQALDHVAGYTVANDVSARDVQFADGQWTRGKSFDTFCPIGPFVVTADEFGDPQDARLWTRVNGRLVQDSTTSLMLFSVAELVSFCSRQFTLESGDLILTGTPWGCGEFRTPRESLQPGDIVECGVDGIGILMNKVASAAELAAADSPQRAVA